MAAPSTIEISHFFTSDCKNLKDFLVEIVSMSLARYYNMSRLSSQPESSMRRSNFALGIFDFFARPSSKRRASEADLKKRRFFRERKFSAPVFPIRPSVRFIGAPDSYELMNDSLTSSEKSNPTENDEIILAPNFSNLNVDSAKFPTRRDSIFESDEFPHVTAACFPNNIDRYRVTSPTSAKFEVVTSPPKIKQKRTFKLKLLARADTTTESSTQNILRRCNIKKPK
ncbi:unnamed protein product, partial [Nesidiocoris tenuis]